MATIVHDLELPELDNQGLDREASRAALEAARAQHWLARIPVGYIVTRHADVAAILSDRRFHSALSFLPQMSGVEDEELSGRQTRSILALEGDEHQRLRRLVSPAFTPRSADRLRPVMRRVIGGLVEPLLPTGRCELVRDVCEPYPIPIICELLGAPAEDWKLFSGWATDIFRIFNNDIASDLVRIKAAMAELDAYVRAMVEERRSTPADDLLSDLIAAEEAGDRLTTDELVMMCEAVLMAGTDTTRNQLACSVALLSEHPDQWRALGEDPDLAKPAVEETMRYLGRGRRHRPDHVGGHRVPRRPLPHGHAGGHQPVRRQRRPGGVGRPPPHGHRACACRRHPHDARLGAAPLPRRRARPRRAPGGAPPLGPLDARPRGRR